jgi:hypothetical protein
MSISFHYEQSVRMRGRKKKQQFKRLYHPGGALVVPWTVNVASVRYFQLSNLLYPSACHVKQATMHQLIDKGK